MSDAKNWLKNTFSQYVVSPLVRYLVADIAIPLIILALLVLYVIVRRKLMGKKFTHQVTTSEQIQQANQVQLPETTAISSSQVSPRQVIIK